MFQYSVKQHEVIKYALTTDWQFLINHGSVRSGKTTADNDIFLFELRKAKERADIDGVQPLYGLSGESIGSIQKNVISELESRYGLTIRLDKYNTFPLLGCRVCCAGHSNADSYKSILGMTAYGFYHNEMTTAHPTFIDEAQKRCSGRFKIIGDTNPDHPEHYIKKNYIDKADQKRIAAFHWTLDDNPFVSKEYKDGIKAITPSGMFYERKINGLWVTADGIVYQDFDGSKHYVDSLDKFKFTHYFAGVDWGYEHWGVIQLWGVTDKREYVLIEEVSAQHQEIDYWVDVAKRIKARTERNIPFFCDSARPEHVARFQRENIRAYNADKNIMSGIEETAKLIKKGKLFIYKPAAELFNKQIYSYSWDKRSGMPVKENDDSMDTMRYVIYTSITKPNIR